MSSDRTKNLVRDTLEQPFDRDRYLYFVKNILNSLDESKSFHYSGKLITSAYQEHISSYERIGQYHDVDKNEIDVLIVNLKKTRSLDIARTMQRNFISWYLNGGRGDKLKDAALVAFVSAEKDSWRFSLVKMDYKVTQSEKGKVKVKQEFTPSKRYSFLVGVHESSHTAQSRLVPIIDNDNNPTLKDLEELFNIEKVTDEFFEKYRNLFLNLKESLETIVAENENIQIGFTSKKVDIADFSKKLLGQIVFLYFLQKKGWFGVDRSREWGSGPKNFLRKLFTGEITKYQNFFNDILEPLFYEALATKRDEDYYSGFNCKIPFLNGGLFDPISDYDWINTDINLPNELFSNRELSKEGDLGTGILDVLDRYNFTVKEDEPLEKEVAIDPEMLGKVFENLLEIKDRKSKGTYYTPREIVHYMCQQSLINYLHSASNQVVTREDLEQLVLHGERVVEHEEQISKQGKETKTYKHILSQALRDNAELVDNKLASITVCDPAIGSGAFPVGMMSEIVKTREILSRFMPTKSNRTPYDFKRHAIANSIFGVDIDAGAVEIAKLRLWLSLIVDEDDIRLIKPLPNLDYKIMQGNSLVELYLPEMLYHTHDQDRNSLIDELRSLKNKFFTTSDRESKREIKALISDKTSHLINYDKYKELNEAKDKLAGFRNQTPLFELGGQTNFDNVNQKEIEKIERKVEKLSELQDLSESDHFEWHLNFDSVFDQGGFDIVIGNPPYVQLQKFKGNPIQEVYKNAKYQVYDANGDLYCLFYERGLTLTKDKSGLLCFITSNKWMRAGYGSKLRQYFADHDSRILIDCGPGIFASATVDTSILLITNNKSTTSKLKALTLEKADLADLGNAIETRATSMPDLSNGAWLIGSLAEQHLKKKVESIGKPLKNWDVKINYGIKTGLNEAFIIDQTTHDQLVAQDPNNIDILKPILRGRDIDRYGFKFANKYLLQTGFDIDIPKLYPKIYEYLKKHIVKAKKREDQGSSWYNLRACAYYDEFEKEKILWPETMRIHRSGDPHFPRFSYTDKNSFYTDKTAFIMTGPDLLYILGIVNSSFGWYLAKNYADKLDKGGYMMQKAYIENYPLPVVSDKTNTISNKIEGLIEKIISHKKDNLNINYLENEIDQLVYQLYDLEPEEIEIVEGRNE